jgi:hypothetical protein
VAAGDIAGGARETDMQMIGESQRQETPRGQVPGLRGTQRHPLVDHGDIQAVSVEGNLDAHVARAGRGGFAHAALPDQLFHHDLEAGGPFGLEAFAHCAGPHGSPRRLH